MKGMITNEMEKETQKKSKVGKEKREIEDKDKQQK